MVVALAVSTRVLAEEANDDDPLVRMVREAIAGALNSALEHAHSNRPVQWEDSATNLTGTITVFAARLQGGTWCRSFKYVVRSVHAEVTSGGLHCRDATGLWRLAGMPDLVDKRENRPDVPAVEVDRPAPDPLLLRLQKNLVRLAYGGPNDGSTDADFTAALTLFEADEGMRYGTDSEAIRQALALSTVTLARSGSGGVCQAPEGEDGATLVCGRTR